MKTPALPEPTAERIAQVELICDCHQRLIGRPLTDQRLRGEALFRAIWEAPLVVVSHDSQADPVFNFGNRCALELWEMSFDEFVRLHSRYSAEEAHREERARLLSEVAAKGYFAGYRGVRTSRGGRRFHIEQALVFNLSDSLGAIRGQAAAFAKWTYL